MSRVQSIRLLPLLNLVMKVFNMVSAHSGEDVR
jgi:hypothetical protein